MARLERPWRYGRGHTTATTAPGANSRRPHGGPVAILEVEAEGHRLNHLRHLWQSGHPRDSVVLTSERVARSEEYQSESGLAGAVTYLLPDTSSRRELLRSAVDQLRTIGVRRLVIPDGDIYLLPLLLLLVRNPRLPLRVTVLLLRTSAITGPDRLRAATVAKMAVVQLLRLFPACRLLFLTDAFGVVTRRPGYPGIRPVNDPVEPVHDAVVQRPDWFPPIEAPRTLIGVFGVISAGKNLPLLIDAVSRVPSATLVVGGRLDPDVRAVLDGPSARGLARADRLVVQDRFLRPGEYGAALASVDVVAVLYDKDAPSCILAEACLRGTPALVRNDGWLGKVVEALGVGCAVPLTTAAVADAIHRAPQRRERYQEAMRRCARGIGTGHFTARLLDPATR